MFCHSCRNWYESDDKRFTIKEPKQVKVTDRVEATAAKKPDPCPYHPKYKGKRYPVNDCSICWELYQFNSKQASVL